MTPDTRDVVLDALRDRLDMLREHARSNPSHFDKATIYGRLHRNTLARELVRVRVAIREIRPTWPAWMSSPAGALMAWHTEGR